jgi:hypothetical protein
MYNEDATGGSNTADKLGQSKVQSMIISSTADLAENYQADKFYNPGTVVMFGGDEEITAATPETTAVAGVISTNPAHLMNGALTGANVLAVALVGRVPCMVIGPAVKGDLMVSAGFGYAKVNNNPTAGTVIGKSLNDFPVHGKGVIEIAVGRF